MLYPSEQGNQVGAGLCARLRGFRARVWSARRRAETVLSSTVSSSTAEYSPRFCRVLRAPYGDLKSVQKGTKWCTCLEGYRTTVRMADEAKNGAIRRAGDRARRTAHVCADRSRFAPVVGVRDGADTGATGRRVGGPRK